MNEHVKMLHTTNQPTSIISCGGLGSSSLWKMCHTFSIPWWVTDPAHKDEEKYELAHDEHTLSTQYTRASNLPLNGRGMCLLWAWQVQHYGSAPNNASSKSWTSTHQHTIHLHGGSVNVFQYIFTQCCVNVLGVCKCKGLLWSTFVTL
jgi:hypothetical protein